MKDTFTQENLRREIEELATRPGWSIAKLARESGVEQASLSRFCKGDQRSLNGANIEKVWPFIYGDKRPPDLQELTPEPTTATKEEAA